MEKIESDRKYIKTYFDYLSQGTENKIPSLSESTPEFENTKTEKQIQTSNENLLPKSTMLQIYSQIPIRTVSSF
jgi:hypothetical protein